MSAEVLQALTFAPPPVHARALRWEGPMDAMPSGMFWVQNMAGMPDAGKYFVICLNAGAGVFQIASAAIGGAVYGRSLGGGEAATWRYFGGDSDDQECFQIYVPTVADQDYHLALNVPEAGLIKRVVTKAVSGTCTSTLKINTTAVTGGVNSVTSSVVEAVPSALNAFVAGDEILTTISANAACLGLLIQIYYTRNRTSV